MICAGNPNCTVRLKDAPAMPYPFFADPPYNLSNDGFTCHAGRAVSVNKGGWDRSEGIEVDFEFHHREISIGAAARQKWF